MAYLLTQMTLYMLATFLLGLLLGWLIWRYSAVPQEAGDSDLRAELDTVKASAAADRRALEALRIEHTSLRRELDACNDQRQALEAQTSAAPMMMAAAAPAVELSRPEGLTAPRSGVPDDLKLISGVGPTLEKLLHSLGYFHFDQIASWTEQEVAWVDDNLEGFKGRVSRDNWIAQAQELSRQSGLV